MRYWDVAIVGGGLAGSIAAAVLGRRGIDVVLVDPHRVYPRDFRCEKLDRFQAGMLHRLGLRDAVLRAATHDKNVWIAQFGMLLDNKPSHQYGIPYDTLVNAVRAEIPARVKVIHAKALSASTGPVSQRLALSNGEEIEARLIVMASGMGNRLRRDLGIARLEVSPCHSLTVGFDLKPTGRVGFEFSALTYFPERTSARMAHLSLFPIGQAMRGNLMVYRGLGDPWLSRVRREPEAALLELMPQLPQITGPFEVTRPADVRPVGLSLTHGYLRPGVVLAGDAFQTACPAAGTGVSKVLVDVERLCNFYIPSWLATGGMDVEKVAGFYADPAKRAADAHSWALSYSLRSLWTGSGPAPAARRIVKFAGRASFGLLRAGRAWLPKFRLGKGAGSSEAYAGNRLG